MEKIITNTPRAGETPEQTAARYRRGNAPATEAQLPTDSAVRKGYPVVTGCLHYFPDALAEVAALSKLGNDKHNPGQPLHWSREKSNDHLDCAGRHLLEAGTLDKAWLPNKVRHSTQLAWRALANLQIEIEEERQRQATPHPAD